MFWLGMILASVIIFIFFVVLLSSLIGVPCLPTHKKQARLMIELAQIKPGMKIIDLGSGTGRLLFLAGQNGAHAIGYELNPVLWCWTKILAKFKKLPGKVEVRMQSLFLADWRDADVVFCFLFENYMKKLEDRLFAELKPGAKIVIYVFPFLHHEPAIIKEGVRVYVV